MHANTKTANREPSCCIRHNALQEGKWCSTKDIIDRSRVSSRERDNQIHVAKESRLSHSTGPCPQQHRHHLVSGLSERKSRSSDWTILIRLCYSLKDSTNCFSPARGTVIVSWLFFEVLNITDTCDSMPAWILWVSCRCQMYFGSRIDMWWVTQVRSLSLFRLQGHSCGPSSTVSCNAKDVMRRRMLRGM